MIIHQHHYCVAPGDAVTNQMFFIYQSLHAAGIASRLYAGNTRGGLSKWFNRYNEHELWNCDLLLLHHSHGNPQLERLLEIEVPKALIYHNITPEHYFRHDPHMGNLCRMGRRQLKTIREATVATFCDSRFNASELKDLGFKTPILFPLIDLSSLTYHRATTQAMDSTTPTIQLLFVGKITAHKNQATLIRMMAHLPIYYQLQLVGSADPIYLDYIKLLAKALKVSARVRFLGKIPQQELTKTYHQSHAFISTSLHEGFGVPLVEAMASQIPVFALDNGAVSETLGGAGVLIKTHRPWEIAQIIQSFFYKPHAIKKVLQSQSVRLRTLQTQQSQQRVQQICRDLVHYLRVIPECDWKSESSNIARKLA